MRSDIYEKLINLIKTAQVQLDWASYLTDGMVGSFIFESPEIVSSPTSIEREIPSDVKINREILSKLLKIAIACDEEVGYCYWNKNGRLGFQSDITYMKSLITEVSAILADASEEDK